MEQGNKKGLGEALIEIYEKLDKYVGILAAIIAALTFAKGNRWISYGFVVIGYCLIATFLWRVITGKSLLRNVIVTPSPLPERQEFDFPKIHRITAAVVLILLTLLSIGWIGVNGWQDIKRLTTPAARSQRPSVTILPEKQTPTTSTTVSLTTTVTPATAGLSQISLTRFAGETLDIYDCIIGESRSIPGNIWAVTAKPQDLRVGTENFSIEDTPRTELKSLLLAPTRIILNGISLVIDEYSPPVRPSEIQLYAFKGCGMGGGPVEKAQFEQVTLRSSHTRYVLTPLTIQVPYYLYEGEALDLVVPVRALEPGAYVLHLEAEILGFSGENIEIESTPMSYRLIYFDTVNAEEVILR